MKAIYKAPARAPEVIEVENTLEALQKKVGGYIEAVTIAPDACIVCNEEGWLRGMPYNITFGGVDLVGPILIVGVDGDEFCSVSRPEFWLEQVKGGG